MNPTVFSVKTIILWHASATTQPVPFATGECDTLNHGYHVTDLTTTMADLHLLCGLNY